MYSVETLARVDMFCLDKDLNHHPSERCRWEVFFSLDVKTMADEAITNILTSYIIVRIKPTAQAISPCFQGKVAPIPMIFGNLSFLKRPWGSYG